MRALRYHPHIQGLLLLVVLWGSIVVAWPLVVSTFTSDGGGGRDGVPAAVTDASKVVSAVMPKSIELVSAPAQP